MKKWNIIPDTPPIGKKGQSLKLVFKEDCLDFLFVIPLKIDMDLICTDCKNKWDSKYGHFALVYDAAKFSRPENGVYALHYKVIAYSFKCKHCKDGTLVNIKADVGDK